MKEQPNKSKMLDEIEKLGYPKTSINKLHYSEVPLPKDIVEIILKWLPKIYEEHIGSGEHLVRALIFTKEQFEPKVLIYLFEKSNLNETLKQTLAHVLSISNVGDISEYVKDKLYNELCSLANSGFLSAITANCRYKTVDELMKGVKKIYDKYSYFEEIHLLFKKYGRETDIPFLQERLTDADKKKQKIIQKIIDAIKSRKGNSLFPSLSVEC